MHVFLLDSVTHSLEQLLNQVRAIRTLERALVCVYGGGIWTLTQTAATALLFRFGGFSLSFLRSSFSFCSFILLLSFLLRSFYLPSFLLIFLCVLISFSFLCLLLPSFVFFLALFFLSSLAFFPLFYCDSCLVSFADLDCLFVLLCFDVF